MTRECVTNLLCLGVLKRLGHTQANSGARARTRRDTPPSYRTIDSVRHRGPACTYARTHSEAASSAVAGPRRRTLRATGVAQLATVFSQPDSTVLGSAPPSTSVARQ